MTLKERVEKLEEQMYDLSEWADSEMDAQYNDFMKWDKKLSTRIKRLFKKKRKNINDDNNDY